MAGFCLLLLVLQVEVGGLGVLQESACGILLPKFSEEAWRVVEYWD